MEIQICHLDIDNRRIVCGKEIARRVREQSKQHLWEDRAGGLVDTVIIHSVSAIEIQPENPFDFETIITIFCDYGVSSHYLIERDGRVYQLVPDEKKAWHCGGSIMPSPDDRTGVNEFSIGIELVATPVLEFTEAQYRSLLDLCRTLEQKYTRRFTYLGHEDIAGTRAVALGLRPKAKIDPGRLFEWTKFRNTIGRDTG